MVKHSAPKGVPYPTLLPSGFLCVLLSVPGLVTAQDASTDQVLEAFEERPGYVQPIPTLFGTALNQSWVKSARVGEGTGWEFSVPVEFAYIGTDDHSYTLDWETGCADVRSSIPDCGGYPDVMSVDVPTIWGGGTNKTLPRVTSTDQGTLLVSDSPVDGGHSDVRSIGFLPMLFLQAGGSKAHTRVVLRGMLVPAVSQLKGLGVYGLGVQYDYTHLIPRKLPVDLSVVTGWTGWYLDMNPGDDYQGNLELSGVAGFTALVVGWRYAETVEVFSELGWEVSSMEAGGDITNTTNGKVFHPSVNTDGRNGFKASINVAFHLGSFQPVFGTQYGAQAATQIGLLQFGKEGTP